MSFPDHPAEESSASGAPAVVYGSSSAHPDGPSHLADATPTNLTELGPNTRITPARALAGPLVSLNLALFVQFLGAHLDERGKRQALFWLLGSIGRSFISYGSIIVHRLRQGIECYAKVTRYITRSDEEALFQMYILGWQTDAGWREPAGNVMSYLIVPVTRCIAGQLQPQWGFNYRVLLQRHVVDIVQVVRDVLSSTAPEEAVILDDPLMHRFALAHSSVPATTAFEPRIGTGVTFAMEERNVVLCEGMAIPSRFTDALPSVIEFSVLYMDHAHQKCSTVLTRQWSLSEQKSHQIQQLQDVEAAYTADTRLTRSCNEMFEMEIKDGVFRGRQ
ncbi:unnamed protein product [Peniophora sp. CBMAI 1063]|nr:unnamed protein product [Peniophora sp. CBMAI 1063]